MYFNLIEKTLKNYLIHIVCGIVFTFLIVCLQGVALNNRIYFLIPILTFSMFLVCIYILVINHIFMMKKIVIKIKWLLYKEQEKQYPILSFILDNIDDIDSIIKNILDCFL